MSAAAPQDAAQNHRSEKTMSLGSLRKTLMLANSVRSIGANAGAGCSTLGGSSSRTKFLFTISNIAPGFGPGRSSQTPNKHAKHLVEPDGIEPTTSCLQSTRS